MKISYYLYSSLQFPKYKKRYTGVTTDNAVIFRNAVD